MSDNNIDILKEVTYDSILNEEEAMDLTIGKKDKKKDKGRNINDE